MNKKIVITEDDLVRVIQKRLVNEQRFSKLLKAIMKYFAGASDEAADVAKRKTQPPVVNRNAMDHFARLTKYTPQLEQRFGRESVDELADFLNTVMIEGKTILRGQNNVAYFNSMSGTKTPVEQLQFYLNSIADPNTDILSLSVNIPRQLVGDPPVVFREEITRILQRGQSSKSRGNASGRIVGGINDLINNKTIKTGLTSDRGKELINNYIRAMESGNQSNINKTLKELNESHDFVKNKGLSDLSTQMRGLENANFTPNSVRLLKRGDFAGREITEVLLPNNQKAIMYRSSGANVASTGKKAGEWFLIPGWADKVIVNTSEGPKLITNWFIKTKETVFYSKGGNKFITDLAKFMETNGSEGLPK